ncbi:MAG TPA: acetolactate synthase [Opitutales bacterium]|nr:acetolactate synthase [Opitutales bacterium]
MDLAPSQRFEPVTQFSIFATNRIGKLNELMQVLACNSVHIAAITTIDTSEAGLFRIVVDYPEAARRTLEDGGFPFVEHRVFAVEVASEQAIAQVCAAMTEAELNILYLYSFLMRPNGRSGLVICVDDNDLASQVLFAHGFKVLCQQDIAR